MILFKLLIINILMTLVLICFCYSNDLNIEINQKRDKDLNDSNDDDCSHSHNCHQNYINNNTNNSNNSNNSDNKSQTISNISQNIDMNVDINMNQTNKESIELLSPSVRDLPLVPTPAPPNEMLSFEEWRKKIAEKQILSENLMKNTIQSQSLPQSQQPSQQSVASTAQMPQTNKKPITKRARNFASYECGAKVVDTNPEADSVLRSLFVIYLINS
jgi:hypothetical protein